MGYTPNLNDRNSEYYYGVDSTYKPPTRKPQQQQRRSAAPSPLLVGDPELKGYDLSRNSAATPQAPRGSGGNVGIVNFGGRAYDMSKPGDKSAYEAAQKAELARQRSRNPNGDIRGGDGLKADGSGRMAPPPTSNPNGVVQSGTQMSPRAMTMDEANKLLTGGYTVQNPFGSTQLPATSATPYFEEKPDTNFNKDLPENMFEQEEGLKLTRNAFDAKSGVEYNAETLQQPANGAIEAAQLTGAPLTVRSGTFQAAPTNSNAEKPEINKGTDKNSGTNWGARTAADNSDPNIARRRAFLDADSSLQGLRRIEAQKGIVVAGGQYNMVNPNAGQEGQNDFIKISKEDRDGYMRGDQGAQDLKSKYVDKITEASNTAEPRTNYSYDSPDVEDPDESIKGTMDDLPKNWLNS